MLQSTYEYKSFGQTYTVWIDKKRYGNGRVALILMSELGPVARATVNLPDEDPKSGEVFIKTWGENEDMLDFLVRNGIVEDTGRDVVTGYARARIARLLV